MVAGGPALGFARRAKRGRHSEPRLSAARSRLAHTPVAPARMGRHWRLGHCGPSSHADSHHEQVARRVEDRRPGLRCRPARPDWQGRALRLRCSPGAAPSLPSLHQLRSPRGLWRLRLPQQRGSALDLSALFMETRARPTTNRGGGQEIQHERAGRADSWLSVGPGRVRVASPAGRRRPRRLRLRDIAEGAKAVLMDPVAPAAKYLDGRVAHDR